MTHVALRPRRAEDLPRLLAIWRAAVLATHPFLKPDDFAAYAVQMEQLYLPLAALEVVEADGVIAGFLGLEGDKVDSLFLDPALHGQGIGRAVMTEVFARRRRVLLDVNEQNLGARAFYEKLGFRPVGRSEVDGAGKPYPLLHLERG